MPKKMSTVERNNPVRQIIYSLTTDATIAKWSLSSILDIIAKFAKISICAKIVIRIKDFILMIRSIKSMGALLDKKQCKNFYNIKK